MKLDAFICQIFMLEAGALYAIYSNYGAQWKDMYNKVSEKQELMKASRQPPADSSHQSGQQIIDDKFSVIQQKV